MNLQSWDIRFLGLAKFISAWSKDPSTKVGAVIVDPNHRVVSLGYNGFPVGIEDDERLKDRETKYKIVLHAESNAIMFANINLNNCTIYTYPFQPCSSCAGLIIQSGIKRIVCPNNDVGRWKENFRLSSQLFEEANIPIKYYDIHWDQNER
jgi:dCMP deaminase